jgi:transposase-like protein
MDGSRFAKKRLALILDTLSGKTTIVDACQKLGINEAAFHKLRRRTLQESLEGLEPRPLGRRPKETSPQTERVEELEEELRWLRHELKAAEIRGGLALAMPHVLKGAKSAAEK